jgi:hypothetical protein
MGPYRSLSEWRAGSSSTWLSSSQILGSWSIHQLSSKFMSSQCPCFFWILQHLALTDLWSLILGLWFVKADRWIQGSTHSHGELHQGGIYPAYSEVSGHDNKVFLLYWSYMQSILSFMLKFFPEREGFGIFNDRRSPGFARGRSKYRGVTRFAFLPLLSLQDHTFCTTVVWI